MAFEYHRHIVNESMETQQKAASSTRAFAVQLAKARNTMLRRANISKGGFESSNEEKDEEKDEPPLSNAMHQKEWRDKGCSKCKLFGCPRGYDEAKECDIFGTPTFERVQKIKAMERYMTKVDKYRQEEKKTALDYDAMQSSTHMVVGEEAQVELGVIDYQRFLDNIEPDPEATFEASGAVDIDWNESLDQTK